MNYRISNPRTLDTFEDDHVYGNETVTEIVFEFDEVSMQLTAANYSHCHHVLNFRWPRWRVALWKVSFKSIEHARDCTVFSNCR